jgi:hypothetical protein
MGRMESIGDLVGWLATESAVYAMVGSLLTGVVALAAWSMSLVASWILGSPRPLAFGRRLLVLCCAAFVLGTPANLIFTAVMRYRFYIPRDPLVDWVPFVPSGVWVLDPQAGGRFVNDGSPALLWCAWAMLAVPVWIGAGLAERRLTGGPARRRPPLLTVERRTQA